MLLDIGNAIGDKLQSLFYNPVTDKAIDDLIKDICLKLISSNVNPKYIQNLREEINKEIKTENFTNSKNKAKFIQNVVFQALVNLLDPKTLPYKIKRKDTNIIVFVGLQGSGKTTSICKYANFYKKQKYRVGVICADTFRAGAFDQIKMNAEKINVPFYGSLHKDPIKVAKEGVALFRKKDFELILVDTSGRHHQEKELFKEMQNLIKEIKPNNIIYVMDSSIGQTAEAQALGFKNAVKVGGIILTKIDGSIKAGGALSSVAAINCPIEFLGVGENMEDIEEFKVKRFVSKILGMGDLEGLAEKLSEIDLDPQEMVEKFSKGKFTIGDFKNFYKKLSSLGPLSSLMKMAPGLSKMEMPDEGKFKELTFVFDSMSKSELNSCGEVFKENNRIQRISKGSGVSKEKVNEILQNYKAMAVVAKKISNMPGMAEMFNLPETEMKGKKKREYAEIKKNFDFLDNLE